MVKESYELIIELDKKAGKIRGVLMVYDCDYVDLQFDNIGKGEGKIADTIESPMNAAGAPYWWGKHFTPYEPLKITVPEEIRIGRASSVKGIVAKVQAFAHGIA